MHTWYVLLNVSIYVDKEILKFHTQISHSYTYYPSCVSCVDY